MSRYLSLRLLAAVMLHLLCVLSYSNSQSSRCIRPEAPSNGRVWFRRQGSDYRAIYTCDAGYVLVGLNVSVCLESQGRWSQETPYCRKADCSEGVAEESLILHPGEPVRLTCRDLSFETHQHLLWIKDDLVLPSQSSILELNPSQGREVEGHYVCLGRSRGGVRVRRAVHARLSSASCPNSPEFLSGSVGSTVLMSCPHISPGNVPSWTLNNLALAHTSSRFLVFPNGTLKITGVTEEDAGSYGCGQCHATHHLHVPTSDLCGLTSEGHRNRRIVDGVRAPENSAPWMCMLTGDREAVVCGCSLVAKKWVVTAAHCLTDEGLMVKLGKRLRRQKEEGEVVRGIRRVVAHPAYRRRGAGAVSENDIALVELDREVVFDRRRLLPVCLPPTEGILHHLPPGTLGVVTGWGRVSVRGGITALSLQMAELPLVPREQCQKSSDYDITKGMFCAGFAESFRPDTCSGDSGGPLVVQWQGRWYLAGVISWGQGCSSPGKYGIYTNVEMYVDWIQSVMGSY